MTSANPEKRAETQMNEIQNSDVPSDKKDKCSTCGATSASEAWNMCNAGSEAVCYGLTLFPVYVRIGRVECGAVGAESLHGAALDSTQKSA